MADMYARIENDTIVDIRPTVPTVPQRRQDTGEWVMGAEYADDETITALGYVPIVEIEPPEVKESQYVEKYYDIVYGLPTEQYRVHTTPLDQQLATIEQDKIEKFDDEIADIVAALPTFPEEPSIADMRLQVVALTKLVSVLVKERDA